MVCVRYICYLCEVEKVVVVAELESRLAAGVGGDEGRQELDVTDAEDARGTDCAS